MRNKTGNRGRKASPAKRGKKPPVRTAAGSAVARPEKNGVAAKKRVRELAAIIHEPVTLTAGAAEMLDDILLDAKAVVGRSTGPRRVVPEGKKT
jgi:hypothetical protein